MHEDVVTLRRTLEAGATGYVSKRESAPILLEAVKKILAGEQYLSPLVALNLETSSFAQTQHALSEREQQILALLTKGETNAEIAESLEISIRTVESYYTRMISKLDLQGMKELRKYAIAEGQ
jgi:DNA-binding NarL/FixJ family response regulator